MYVYTPVYSLVCLIHFEEKETTAKNKKRILYKSAFVFFCNSTYTHIVTYLCCKKRCYISTY